MGNIFIWQLLLRLSSIKIILIMRVSGRPTVEEIFGRRASHYTIVPTVCSPKQVPVFCYPKVRSAFPLQHRPVQGGGKERLWTFAWSEANPDISRNRSHASPEPPVCLGLVSHVRLPPPPRNVSLGVRNKQSWETGNY